MQDRNGETRVTRCNREETTQESPQLVSASGGADQRRKEDIAERNSRHREIANKFT